MRARSYDGSMRVVMLMFVALAGATIGGAMLWAGLAARGGRLQPGHRLGIRTATTIRSDIAWYAAHRAASWPIVLGGVASLLTGLGVGAVRPNTDFALSFMLLPFAPVALALSLIHI